MKLIKRLPIEKVLEIAEAVVKAVKTVVEETKKRRKK